MTGWVTRPEILTQRRFWLQLLVIVALLGLVAFLGWRFVPGSPGRATLIAFALIGVPTLLVHLEIALPTLMIVGALVTFRVGTGTQSEINAAMIFVAIMVGIWVVRMIVAHDVRLVNSPVNAPLLGFLLIAGLSLLYGNVIWRWDVPRASNTLFVQLGAWSLMALSVGAFFWVANVIQDAKWLKVLVFGLVIISCLAGANALLPGTPYYFRGINSIAGLWAGVMAFAQIVFNRRLVWPWRALCVLTLAFWLYWGVRYFGWMSGWAPLITALLVVSLLRSWRLFLVVFLCLAVLTAMNWPLVHQTFFIQTQADGTLERIGIWQDMLQVIHQSPWLGLGPGSYSYYIRILFPGQRVQSHNQYLDILAQTGIAGALFFAWALWEIGRLGARLRRKFRADFCQAYVCGVVGGLAGMLVGGIAGDWLLPYVYNIGFKGFPYTVYSWLFLGGLVALDHLARGERRER